MFRRILVGFDGSERAAHALRITLGLAENIGAEVVVLCAFHVPPHIETEEERAREAASAREISTCGLDRYQADASARGVAFASVVIEHREPAAALASYATDHGFDLLVIGAHGRDRGTHAGIGHSLDKLLHAQPCPVLVV